MSEPGEPEINRCWDDSEWRLVRGLPTVATEHTGPVYVSVCECMPSGQRQSKTEMVAVSSSILYCTEHSAAPRMAMVYTA